MNKYDIHQTRWAHDCALAIDAIVPLDGPSMARVEAALLERWPVPQGWVPVPQEPTEAMLKAGGHANSEWLNDNAPIGEARYTRPMVSVWRDMIAAAPQPAQEKP